MAESSRGAERGFFRNTSPSIAGSNSTIALRLRVIQGPTVNPNNYAEYVQTYTERMFERYVERGINDQLLWESLQGDFDFFTDRTWALLLTETWELIKRTCITQGVYLDTSGTRSRKPTMMQEAIDAPSHREWTEEQILWAEAQGYSLSPAVKIRKAKLLQDAEGSAPAATRSRASQPAASTSLVTPQTGYAPPAENGAHASRAFHFPEPLGASNAGTGLVGPSLFSGLPVPPPWGTIRRTASVGGEPLQFHETSRSRRPLFNLEAIGRPRDQPAANTYLIDQGVIEQPPSRPQTVSIQPPPVAPVAPAISQPRPSQDVRVELLEEEAKKSDTHLQQPRQREPRESYWPYTRDRERQNPPPSPSQLSYIRDGPATYLGQRPMPQNQFVPINNPLEPPPAQYQSHASHAPQAPPHNSEHRDSTQHRDNTKPKTDYSRELTSLEKGYKTDEKFTGTGDNLGFKLAVFYDKCGRAGVPESAYIQAASVMLGGHALNWYFTNRVNCPTWADLMGMMTKFFEGPEWLRRNITKWQTITLTKVIRDNPTFTISECLTKLFDEMDQLQRNIGPQFSGSFHLREAIIRAVRGHPALLPGLTVPAVEPAELINNLHTSIVNYEAVHKPPQHGGYVQSYNGDVEEDEGRSEAYYTARQYRGGSPQMRGRGRFSGNRGGSYRGPPRRPYFQKKKCFVCKKEGCWSTNHTQQERDESKKAFDKERPQFRNRPDYEKAYQRFLTEYEGDQMDEIDQFFEEFTIDTTGDETYLAQSDWSDHVESNQQFFTSLGALEMPE